MSTCCQPEYEREFNISIAEKELRDYLTKGLKKNSRPLRDILHGLPVREKSLLDIGGGIGALTFELIDRGISKAVYVDISTAYLRTFRSELQHREQEEQVTALQGDFLEVHSKVPVVDLVTLDKVICCYENYTDLVRLSSAKARRWYAFTLPRNVWWVRWGHGAGQWLRHLIGRSFTSYVHSVEDIERILTEAGFQKKRQSYRREWTTLLFERKRSV